jgi:hypothetical protein
MKELQFIVFDIFLQNKQANGNQQMSLTEHTLPDLYNQGEHKSTSL